MTYGEYTQLSPSNRGVLLIREELSSILLAYRALCKVMDVPIKNEHTFMKYEIDLRLLANRMHKVTADYCEYLEATLNVTGTRDLHYKHMHTVNRKWRPVAADMQARITACRRARGELSPQNLTSIPKSNSKSFAGCALG
jgi:hypothetical protein